MSQSLTGGWFFEDPDRVTLLRNAAAKARHTPWRQHGTFPGINGGFDCIGLSEFLLSESGAINGFSFPRRKHDYSQHVINGRVLKYLRGKHEDPQSKELAKRFGELSGDSIKSYGDLMAGDLVLLNTTHRDATTDLYHVPIVIDPPRMLQCAYPSGVSECDAFDPQYNEKVVAVFRARAL